MSTTKKDSFSIFKGIGIILMVIGHSGCPKYISNYIYLFHMALFYCVSGYFFNEKYLNDWFLFIKQKLKGLYIPFVKFSLLFLALHNIFYKLNIYNSTFGYNGNVSYLYSIPDYLNKFKMIVFHFSGYEQLLGAFWFLRSLFIVNIFFFLSIWISKRISKQYYLFINAAIVVIYMLISYALKEYNYILPLGIGRDMSIVILMYLGYIVRKLGIEEYSKNLYLILFCFVILGVFSLHYNISIVEGKFTNSIIFLLSSIFGCTMILGISYYIENSKAKNFLKYIGNNTIIILVYHFLAFKLVSLIIIKTNNLDIKYLASFPVLKSNSLYWIFYSIIGISLPIGFNILREKYTPLIKYFFKKQIRLIENKISS